MSDQSPITRRGILLGATTVAAATPIAPRPFAGLGFSQAHAQESFKATSFQEQLLYQRAFEAVLWATEGLTTH